MKRMIAICALVLSLSAQAELPTRCTLESESLRKYIAYQVEDTLRNDFERKLKSGFGIELDSAYTLDVGIKENINIIAMCVDVSAFFPTTKNGSELDVVYLTYKTEGKNTSCITVTPKVVHSLVDGKHTWTCQVSLSPRPEVRLRVENSSGGYEVTRDNFKLLEENTISFELPAP